MLSVDPVLEVNRIIAFLQGIVKKTGLKNVVIGWSGGVDSTVCLYLLARALPPRNIHVLHMPYIHSSINGLTDSKINRLKIFKKNIHEISIKKAVDEIWGAIGDVGGIREIGERVRLGNIMARVRMIMLFDYAKKVNGLVCGTENKSEHLLGYFTRYGDGASDIEPIQHLFKTQVFELAKYLGVPYSIIKKRPSANLWEGQTDEGEFGFTYRQADGVLGRIRDIGGIRGVGREKVKKIMERVRRNRFKREVPYSLKI